MSKNKPATNSKPATTGPKGADGNKAPEGNAPANTTPDTGDKAKDTATADKGTEQPAQPTAEQPAQPTAEQLAAEAAKARAEMFSNLPVVTIGETSNVVDMTGMETSLPRKYEKVHTDAVGGKLPVMRGWKHAAAVFIPGHNKGGENGWKPGSVYGTIADIVSRAGRSGITAQELVTQVRQRQMGANKRSHYCDKLPPVGWAEGWINTAVTKNVIGVHATKKAPALLVAENKSEATPEQNAAAAQSDAAKEGAKQAA